MTLPEELKPSERQEEERHKALNRIAPPKYEKGMAIALKKNSFRKTKPPHLNRQHRQEKKTDVKNQVGSI